MKKIKLILCSLVFIVCLGLTDFSVLADDNIKLYRAGYEYALTNEPKVINDRVYIPLREAFGAIGVTNIVWNAAEQEITAEKSNTRVVMKIGEQEYTVKNSEGAATYRMDAAPIIIDSFTYVPVRYAVEGFGYGVEWDADNKAITLVGDFSYLGYDDNTPYNILRSEQAVIENGYCQFAIQFENRSKEMVTPSGYMIIDILDSDKLNMYHEVKNFNKENYYISDDFTALLLQIPLSSIPQTYNDSGIIYIHLATDDGISFDTTINVSGLPTKY